MNKVQELEAIEAALGVLDEYEIDYSVGKIAALTGLSVDAVNGYVHRAGWREMGHQYSSLGYWELND